MTNLTLAIAGGLTLFAITGNLGLAIGYTFWITLVFFVIDIAFGPQ